MSLPHWDGEFNPNRFRDPLVREGLFCDRKSELYDWSDGKKRFDLVKDVIALANMSYRAGRACHLLFGVNDAHEIIGIAETAKRLPGFENFDLSLPAQHEKALTEIVGRKLEAIIRGHISPDLELEMQYGEVDGKLCAYLQLRANFGEPQGYRVKQGLQYTDEAGKTHQIKKDEAWKRALESNRPVRLDELARWPSATECPIIAGEQWRGYFDRLQGGEFAKDYKLMGYLEPKLSNGELLIDRVRAFISAPDEMLLVIVGQAGMGKSTFLKRLVYELARDAVPYLKDTWYLEPPKPPATLPVFAPLQDDTFVAGDSLALRVIQWWNKDRIKLETWPTKPTRFLEFPNARWLVCLDAVDELPDVINVKAFYSALQSFRREIPRVKVLLTTRPDAVNPSWKAGGYTVEIAPLTKAEKRAYLAAHLIKDYGEAVELLEQSEELSKLTPTPLYLYAYYRAFSPDEHIENNLLNEYNDDEAPLPPPTNAQILARMVDHIWKHDSDKHWQMPLAPLSSRRPLGNLEKLAAKVDGQITCTVNVARRILETDQAINRFLSLGLLEMVPPRYLRLGFLSLWLQAFLAGQHVQDLWADNRTTLRRWLKRNSFWNSVYQFAKDTTYDPDLTDFLANQLRIEPKPIRTGDGTAVT